MSDTSDSFYKSVLDNLYDGLYLVNGNRRITYWNKGAERLSGYSREEVVGSRCADNILRHITEQGLSLCKSDCPLGKSIEDGKIRESEVYLHHKEGHRVPVLVRTAPLRDKENNIIGGVEIFGDNSRLMAIRRQIKDLQELALIDELTQVGNRRYIEVNISKRIDEMERYSWPFGVLFIDIDHFKDINDAYGHATGDEVLKMVTKTVMLGIRIGDSVGRWGGEEFVAILSNVEEGQLRLVAERIRMLVEKSSLPLGSDTVQVSVSIGATLGRRGDKADSLMKRVDQLMYRSKLSGRNRVTVDSDKELLSISQW
jgi:diguanylate cyclase (GGDEF)-like protein/PAS domain S-box-containing protein